ncbi:MAG: glutathione peroxidase [Candidatus Eisenbacteria bacterium]|nr:glutathione peroxidase [Candidatus Eisenbacteria bacterium]
MTAYEGQILLIVNVASKCGFTPQYEGLERLYQRYAGRGFAVLGFPSNSFMNQEPGTDRQIRQFCASTYKVTFPMFSKLSVKGSDKHPLFAYLTSPETNPEFGGEITWNFNKFLIGRDGKVLDRFGSATRPESPELVLAIEEALQD